jgi:hypothetical protein
MAERRSVREILREVEQSAAITEACKGLIRVALGSVADTELDPRCIEVLYPRVTQRARDSDFPDEPKTVLEFTAPLGWIMQGGREEMEHPTNQWACPDGMSGPIVRTWSPETVQFEVGDEPIAVMTFHPLVLELPTRIMCGWLKRNRIQILEPAWPGDVTTDGVRREIVLTGREWEAIESDPTLRATFGAPCYDDWFEYVDLTSRTWDRAVPDAVRQVEREAIKAGWGKAKARPEVKAQVEWIARQAALSYSEWSHPRAPPP